MYCGIRQKEPEKVKLNMSITEKIKSKDELCFSECQLVENSIKYLNPKVNEDMVLGQYFL